MAVGVYGISACGYFAGDSVVVAEPVLCVIENIQSIRMLLRLGYWMCKKSC